MNVEIAKEPFSNLSDIKDCPKNESHDDFVTFEDFSLDHLPVGFQNEEVLKFVKNIGQRVVRLSVTKPSGEVVYGSGVVYKVDSNYLVLTNDHVVSCPADVKNCVVDFFYHSSDFSGVQRCQGDELLGGSSVQDRCYFTFYPIPDKIQQTDMFDYSDLVAKVVVKHKDDSASVSNSYVFIKEDKTLVLLPRYAIKAPGDIESIDVSFETSDGVVESAKVVGIPYYEDKCVYIEVTDLPQFVKDALVKSWDAPWPEGNPCFTPTVIAHPHGGPKMVTLGKMLSVVAEHGGVVKKLYHTARTCPGSSGGLVLTIGGDATVYLGYASNRCMHSKGERADDYQGQETGTGNLNVSLFNN